MDLFNRKNLKVRRSHQTAVWTFTDDGVAESVADIFIQAPGEVYYLRQRFMGELPEPSLLYYTAYKNGVRSTRPYQLARGNDASTFYCVLALAVSCCKAWSLDPIGVLTQADPNAHVSRTDLQEFKHQARWEQVVFPPAWHTQAIEGLCHALIDVDLPTLAALIARRTIGARGH